MTLRLDQLSTQERDVILSMRAEQGRAPAAPPGEEPAEGQRRFGEFAPANPPTVTRIIDPASWVQKQINTLQAVGAANYSEGVTRPKRDPIAAGIAAQAAYVAAMRDANVLARREAGLRRTSMEVWGAMCESIGAQRLVDGVIARRAKVEQAVSSLHSKLTAHLRMIDAMPNVTPADRERRMVENLRGLRAFKGS
ncbi:hypothetical protein ES703_20681 [subsurface metagenome]